MKDFSCRLPMRRKITIEQKGLDSQPNRRHLADTSEFFHSYPYDRSVLASMIDFPQLICCFCIESRLSKQVRLISHHFSSLLKLDLWTPGACFERIAKKVFFLCSKTHASRNCKTEVKLRFAKTCAKKKNSIECITN